MKHEGGKTERKKRVEESMTNVLLSWKTGGTILAFSPQTKKNKNYKSILFDFLLTNKKNWKYKTHPRPPRLYTTAATPPK